MCWWARTQPSDGTIPESEYQHPSVERKKKVPSVRGLSHKEQKLWKLVCRLSSTPWLDGHTEGDSCYKYSSEAAALADVKQGMEALEMSRRRSVCLTAGECDRFYRFCCPSHVRSDYSFACHTSLYSGQLQARHGVSLAVCRNFDEVCHTLARGKFGRH